MADVRVQMDESAIMALAADWTSPVGQLIEEITAQVHATAKASAPASAKGSEYAGPGYLRTRIAIAHSEDAAGVLGLVGIPLFKGSRYPYNFVHSASGTRRVRNGWSKPGTVYKVMAANNLFLENALESASLFGGY